MEQTAEFYIGENPDINQVEVDKVKDILKSRHKQFVIKGFADGFWDEKMQETLIVLVTDLEEVIYETLDILKKELNQDTIAVIESNDLRLV